MTPRGRVLIVGAGGLGSPVALLLAEHRAACGGLTLIDDDRVEQSNLHRQLLHGETDLGRPKVDSARDTLRWHAPDFPVTTVKTRLGPGNAAALLAGHAVVVDGSDSIDTKFLVNDTALRLGIPAVIGGVVRFAGQVLTVLPHASSSSSSSSGSAARTACYRCLFEEPPPPGSALTCQAAGVLGPACGVIGALLAAEVLRLLRGQAPSHAGVLLSADLLSGAFRTIALSQRAGCPACAGAATTATTATSFRDRP